MPEPPDLSVSIVTCNSEQWLPSLLASLEAQQGVRWELFVVDNASSDRTLSILGERQRGEIIRNVENVGFGRGHNQLRDRFRGRHLLFLNPDVQLPPGLFQALVEFLDEHPRIAIAGPMVLEGPDETPFPPRRFYPGEALIPLAPGLDRCEPAWVNGCCFAIRRDVFVSLGGFDPDYFLYVEEIDLCWRVRRAGYGIGFLADRTVRHYGRGSQAQLTEYEKASKLFSGAVLFWEKRHPLRDRAALLRFQVWGAQLILMALRAGLQPRNPRFSPARLRARRDVCRASLALSGCWLCAIDTPSARIALRLGRLALEWVRRGGQLPLDDV